MPCTWLEEARRKRPDQDESNMRATRVTIPVRAAIAHESFQMGCSSPSTSSTGRTARSLNPHKHVGGKILAVTFLFVMAVILAGMLLVPLAFGVWLPDVFSDREHTLAEQRLASGHSFRVIQYWNHGDFYTTKLLHTSPDGTVEKHVLDGDDDKSWRVPLMVDEQRKTATVTLGGGRVRIVKWK